MNDYASETDSEYTNYWRDWAYRLYDTMVIDWNKRWQEDQVRRRGKISPRGYDLQNQAEFLIGILKGGRESTDWNLLQVAFSELLAQIDDERANIDEAERERRREARLSLLKFNQFVEYRLAEPSFAYAHVSNDDQAIQQQIDDFYNAFLETDYGRCLQPMLNADTFADHLGNGFLTLQKTLRSRRKFWPTELEAASPTSNTTHRLPSYSEAINQKARPKSRCKLPVNTTTSQYTPPPDEEIRYCPPLQPPTYQGESQRPPEYGSTRHSIARSRYEGDFRRTSEDSTPLDFFYGPAVPLHTSVDYLRTHFATDPRSKHSSQAAEALGIRKSSLAMARKVTPRRNTDGNGACVDLVGLFRESTPNSLDGAEISEDDVHHVKARRRSLGLLSSEDYSAQSSSANNVSDRDVNINSTFSTSQDCHNNNEHAFSENYTRGRVYSEFIGSRSDRNPSLSTNEGMSTETASLFSWAKSASIEFQSEIEDDNSESSLRLGPNASINSRQNLTSPESRPSPNSSERLPFVSSQHTFGSAAEAEHRSDPVLENDPGESESLPSELGDLCDLLNNIVQESGLVAAPVDQCEMIIDGQNRGVTDRYGLASPSNRKVTHVETGRIDNLYNSFEHKRNHKLREVQNSNIRPSTMVFSTSLDTLPCSSSQSICSSPTSPMSCDLNLRGGSVTGSSPREMGPSTLSPAVQRRINRVLRSSKSTGQDSLWILRFINSRGNEYFCDVDEEYLTDRFNLTGLNTEVQYYQYALDLITDVFDLDCDDEVREQIEKSARHLYGLVHARYIATNRGLQKMMEKYKNGDFGKCPRVACQGQFLLPTGQNDTASVTPVKLYCARCEDLYNPKSPRHSAIDGAYFGTSFPHILFQVYPQALPEKSQKRYEPRIYGFRVHAAATLARWQTEKKEEMKLRLMEQGQETGFEREEMEDEMEFEEEDEIAQDGIDDMFEGRRASGTIRR